MYSLGFVVQRNTMKKNKNTPADCNELGMHEPTLSNPMKHIRPKECSSPQTGNDDQGAGYIQCIRLSDRFDEEKP